jgi:hypothetical protein
MAQVSERLIDDHAALDRVLKQLQAALRTSDVESAHTKLDLFWARLAVHIRAEHLHLFPTVLSSLENRAISDAPTLDQAQTVVAQLRQDHDFFMHELARAVEIMRQLATTSELAVLSNGLAEVKNTLLEVEQRLVKHNEVEENQIYHWAALILNSGDQEKLIERITMELRKHPARFTPATWSDQ